jgi:hypothetical protein
MTIEFLTFLGIIITLLGVIITFLTTIVGWIFTYRTQVNILKRQSEISFEKEQRQVLIGDHLAFLKSLEEWFEKGRRIQLEATLITPIGPSIKSVVGAENLSREEGLTKLRNLERDSEKVQQAMEMLKEFRADGPKLMYLARLYDSQSASSTQWIWGSPNMPTDLPQIINAYEDEVIDQVTEAVSGEQERAFPKVEEQFHNLHEAGVQAIEKLKGYLVTENHKRK